MNIYYITDYNEICICCYESFLQMIAFEKYDNI
jgi:hypothetical protein